MDQLDEFHKVIDDLENINMKIDNEDKAIILLNSLPKMFEHLKDAMLNGRNGTISLEEVESVLRSKGLQRINEGKIDVPAGESLNVKSKPGKGGKFKKSSQDFKKSGYHK